MTAENQPPTVKKSAGARHPAGILLRLILSALAGILIGGAVYFTAAGWIPYLDQRVFQPIDQSQARIQELQEAQAILETQVFSLQSTWEEASSSTSIQGTLSSLQDNQEQLGEDLLDSRGQIDRNTTFLLQYTQSLATLEARLDNTESNLGALATAQMANTGRVQEIELLKILDLFSRANQFLLHSNYGLAEDELATASSRLTSLLDALPEYQGAAVGEILDLVDGAISDLPARPEVAEEKIQLAWELTISGLPEFWDLPTGTATPTPSITTTPTTGS